MKPLSLLTLLLLCCLNVHAQQTWQWGKRGGSTSTLPNLTPFKEPVLDMATDPHGNVYMVANVGGENLDVDGTILDFHFPADYYGVIDRTRPGGLLMSYDCDGNFRWSKLISGTYCGVGQVETDTLGHVYITAGILPATKDIWGTEYRAHFDTDTIYPYSADPKRYKQSAFLIQYDTVGNFKRMHTYQQDSLSILETGSSITSILGLMVEPTGIQHIFIHAQNYEHQPGVVFYPVAEGDTLVPGDYILKYDRVGNYLGNVKLDMELENDYGGGFPPKLNYDHVRKAYYMSGWNKTPHTGTYQDSLWIGGQLVDSPMFAVKFDSLGNSVWLKQAGAGIYGANNFDKKPEIDNQGNIYLGGTFLHGSTPVTFNGFTPPYQPAFPFVSTFPAIVKMDSDGNLIWGTNATHTDAAVGISVITVGKHVSLANDYAGIIWGNYSFPPIYNDGYDLFHAQFDKETGAIISMDTIGSNRGFSERPTAMASDKRGNVYIGGEFQGKMYVGNDTLTNIHSGGIGTDYFLVKSGHANCSCVLPEAVYSYGGANGTVQFTYTGSPGYDKLEWGFGDGTVQTTTTGTISHTFADTIEYWVCVTAYNSCGHDTWCTWVDPHRLSKETLAQDSFKCYPNPVEDLLNIEASEPLTYTLFDLSGRTVGQGTLSQGANTVDTANLPQGMYMLQLKNAEGAQRVVKLVKK